MQDCWFTDPEMRPNFIQLELFFERYEKDFQVGLYIKGLPIFND